MASRNKKTTMAKLSRESKLRERRVEKQARKEARKHASELERSAVDSPLLDEESVPEPSGASPDRPGLT